MAEKRNNDWTDALRERLSSSESAPASDIWSKVESAVAEMSGSRRTLPKPFWWAACCIAAAALAAIMILPQGSRDGSLQVDPRPQALSASAPAVVQPSVPSSVPDPSAVSSAPAQRQYRPSAVPPAESFDETVMPEAATEAVPEEQPAISPGQALHVDDENSQASDRSPDATANPSRPAYRTPVEDKFFESIHDESSERKKGLTASLFASGIPGSSGTDGKYLISTASLVNDGSQGFGSFISSSGPDPATLEPYMGYYETTRILKNIHHHHPVSMGLALSYPLTDRWFLESGLMYSYLRSEYDLPSGHPIMYEIDGKRFESSVQDSDQRLHFIGIPLKAGYRFTTPSRFSVALSAGAMAERCVHGEWLGNKVPVRGTQFSAVVSASARYRMTDRLSLFLSPEWSYYFTETDLPTYHTDTPVSMTLRVGLTLDLGNISLPEK